MSHHGIEQILHEITIPLAIQQVPLEDGETLVQYMQKLDEVIEELMESQYPEYVFRSETALKNDLSEGTNKPTSFVNNQLKETNLTSTFKFRVSYGLRAGEVTLEKEYLPPDRPAVEFPPITQPK